MPTTALHDVRTNTPVAAQRSNGRVVSCLKRSLPLLFTILSLIPVANAGTHLQITTAPGGIPISAVGGNYRTSFGTMNGLGIGTPSAGLTVAPLANGALYYSEVNLTITTFFGPGYVTAYLSGAFQHPAALVAWACPSGSACTTPGGYSPLPTSAGGAINIVPSPGVASGSTVTVGIAIFVPDNNGASAATGNDNGGTITFAVIDNVFGGIQIETDTLKLSSPRNKIETAIELELGSDPSGLTITPANDFSMDYGNVNGLGVGAGAGITPVAQPGGTIYSTPYQLLPAFSDLSSTNGTITVCTQTPFANAVDVNLQDSGNVTGPFTLIPDCAATVQITNAAADRSTITRYLGLFVSKVNGPTSFTGSSTSTLTYTITVP